METSDFIYFAHRWMPTHGHTYKIGVSNNPAKRVAFFGSAENPCTLLITVKGRWQDEQAIHELFTPFAVKNEWYKPARRLHRLMAYCDRVGALPESVKASGDAWMARRLAKRAFVRSQTQLGSDLSSESLNPGLADPWFPRGNVPANDDLTWLPEGCRKRMENAK